MKKVTLLAATMFIIFSAFSQNVVSFRLGLDKYFETGSKMSYGPGASFQHAMTENVALGFNFDFHLSEISGVSMLNFEPRVDYYLNEMFKGFHVGSNIGLGLTMFTGGSSKMVQLGANLGYSLPLGEKLLFDVSSGLGYGMSLETGGGGSFGVKPVLSLGYKL